MDHFVYNFGSYASFADFKCKFSIHSQDPVVDETLIFECSLWSLPYLRCPHCRPCSGHLCGQIHQDQQQESLHHYLELWSDVSPRFLAGKYIMLTSQLLDLCIGRYYHGPVSRLDHVQQNRGMSLQSSSTNQNTERVAHPIQHSRWRSFSFSGPLYAQSPT